MDTLIFFFSKIFMWFLSPVPVLFVAGLLVILRMKRDRDRPRLKRVALLVWIVAYVICMPATGDLLIALWETPAGDRTALNAEAPYDAAIVLGGSLDPVGSQGWHKNLNQTAERLTDTVRLYREGVFPKIIVSGGSGNIHNQELREAPAMVSFFEGLGVSPSDLITEEASRNTSENLRNSLAIARDRGFGKVLLITSALHMPRAHAIALKAGFSPPASAGNAGAPVLYVFPVDGMKRTFEFPNDLLPSEGAVYRLSIFWHEAFGFLVYGILGRL